VDISVRRLRLFGEHHRLHAGDLEAFAAAHILAGHQVVFAEHVGAGFGKARAVTLIGASGELTSYSAGWWQWGQFKVAGFFSVRSSKKSRSSM